MAYQAYIIRHMTGKEAMLPFPELSDPHRLSLPDAEIIYYPHFFPLAESNKFFDELLMHTQWRQDKIVLYGREVMQPRLTAWYGDTGKSYRYSGLTLQPTTWTESLLSIKARIEASAHTQFNSVLINCYRNGQDSVGWHADDEPELGHNPVIASISFGAARNFQLRHKKHKNMKKELLLEHGSLLVMRGTTQLFWHHQIPKTAKPVGKRINLTFRVIK
jgi:alkylated DNA repair dioxygenase AlkB